MKKIVNAIASNIRIINLFILIILSPFFISCEKKMDLDSILTKGKMNAELIKKSSKNETAREYEFYDYSSQGGVVRVVIDNNSCKWFYALLYGEIGKEKYECYPFENNLYIVRTTYTYDKSIYDGDVNIINEDKEILVIINGVQYLVSDNTII